MKKIKYIILGEFSKGDTRVIDHLLEEARNIDGENTILLNKLSLEMKDIKNDYDISKNNIVININIFNNSIRVGIYNKKDNTFDYPKKWSKITDLHSKELLDLIDSL